MGTLRTLLATTGVIKDSSFNSTFKDEPTLDSHQQQSLQAKTEQQQPEYKHHQAEIFFKQAEQNGYGGQGRESRLFSTTITMLRIFASIPSQRRKNKNCRMRQQLLLNAKRKRRSPTTPVAPICCYHQRNRNGTGLFFVVSMHGIADDEVVTYSGYNGNNNNCSPVHTQPSTTTAIPVDVVPKKRLREQNPGLSTRYAESIGSSEEQRPTRRRALMMNNQLNSSVPLIITSISSVFTPVSVPIALHRPPLSGLTSQAPVPRKNIPHLVPFMGLSAYNDPNVTTDVDSGFDVDADIDGPAMDGSNFSKMHTYYSRDLSDGQGDENDNQDNSSGTSEVPNDEGQGHGDAHDGSQDSNDSGQRDDDNGSDSNNNSEDKDDDDQEDEDQDEDDENDDDQDDEDQDDEDQDDEDQNEDEADDEDEGDGESMNMSMDANRSSSSTGAPSSSKDDNSKDGQVSSPSFQSPLGGDSGDQANDPQTTQIKSDEALAHSLHQTRNQAIARHPTAAHNLSISGNTPIIASGSGSSSSTGVTPLFGASSSSNVASGSRTHQTSNVAGTFDSSISNVAAVASSSSAAPVLGYSSSHVSMPQSSSQQSSHSGSDSSSGSASASGSPGPSLSPQSHLRDSYLAGFSDGHLHGYIMARRHAPGAHMDRVASNPVNSSSTNTTISNITTNTPSAVSPPQFNTLISGELLGVVERSWSEYSRLHAAAQLDPSLQPPPRIHGFGVIPGQGFGYGEIIGPGLIRALPDFSRPYSIIPPQDQNPVHRSAMPVSAAPWSGPMSGSSSASSNINVVHIQQQHIAPISGPGPGLSSGLAPGGIPPGPPTSTVPATVPSAVPVMTSSFASVAPMAPTSVQMSATAVPASSAAIHPMVPAAAPAVIPTLTTQAQNQTGGEQQCTAVAKKTGLRCKRRARANGRCYLH